MSEEIENIVNFVKGSERGIFKYTKYTFHRERVMSFYGHHPSYLFKLQRTEEVGTMEVRFLNLYRIP